MTRRLTLPRHMYLRRSSNKPSAEGRGEFCGDRGRGREEGREGKRVGWAGRTKFAEERVNRAWLSFDFDVRRHHHVPPEKSAISYHLPVARHRVNGHVNAIILLLMKSAPSIRRIARASLLGNRAILILRERKYTDFVPSSEPNFLS